MTENELVEQRTRLQMLAVALTAVVIALAAYILLARKGEAPPLPAATETTGSKAPAGVIHLNPQAQKEANLGMVLAASSVEKDTIRANGQITVNENETWHVGALAEGKVTQVLANIGDHVKQGQVLALMHSHTVHETRAAFIQAQAELDRAIAHKEMARRVADRAQRLLKVEAISQEQADQAANDVRNSESAIVKARADLDKETQHMTEFLEIDPHGAKHAGDATEDPDAVPIKAPNAGVILRRLVSSGSVLSVGQEAFTISNLNSLWVIAGVNEADLAAVRPGMQARISVRAFPERTFAGTVLQLGEELDPATRTLKVRINLPNAQGNLKPEMFAQVDLEQGASRAALYIPESAIEDVNGQKVAFVQTGGDSFQVRTLRIGATTNGMVEVTGGISEGERVVTRGAFALKSELLKSSLQGNNGVMLNRIIDAALNNRLLVAALLAAVIIVGLVVMLRLPIDAFPDLTNNQVVVITECPAMPPLEVESRVTFPIETALMGLPKTLEIRSTSKLGLSMTTVIFEDQVNTYFARQLVNERVQEARSRLPQGLEPTLGPVATAFGEVLQYTVDGNGLSLMDRKTLHDWSLRFQLRTIPGVNEVNSWGGDTKQYVIEVNPDALQRYGLTLRDVFLRVQDNNENFGGGFIQHLDQQYTVYGLGRATSLGELGKTVLLARAGVPVLLSDVANIVPGAMPRQGAVLRDGKGETVSGMIIALKGANGLDVIEKSKQKLAAMHLPEGVKVVPFYDQSEVIYGTIHTVERNLLEAGILVIVVLLVFLGNLRAALLVACVIPVAMLFGFIGMAAFGVSANLMSLGAIDFGMIVDGAVVMVENSVRRIGESGGQPVRRTVRDAAIEVSRPIVFGVAIIVAVYLPILTLEGLEGRMFRPMAITVCSALLGALVLSLTVVPVASTFGLRASDKESHARWFEVILHHYARVLDYSMHHRTAIVAFSLLLMVVALGSLKYIGTEFMPKLDEGSILIQTRKLPGVSLPESISISSHVEKAVMEFPEVSGVVSKLGRPDLATEAMGVYEADVYVLLKPHQQWRKGLDKEALVDQMSKRMERIPGLVCNFTQPMAMRLDEVVSGIKADVAVKIFGSDLATLEQLADRALKVISAIPGAADSQAEILTGVPELRVAVDRDRLSRYGLDVRNVRDLLDSTTGGTTVSEMIEGERQVPIVVRLPQAYRNDLQALGNLQLQSTAGERVRLNQIARIAVEQGPEVINREGARRRIVVQCNVRGRDLGSFVSEAQQHLNRALKLPSGYTLEWGGQFENQDRAVRRLMIVLPLSIAIIFGLLFATFSSVRQALLIFSAVPFALVGGIAALWIRGLNLNLSAMVGFIALFGVAVLNGIVMVSCINQMLEAGLPLHRAIREGALTRLRPVMMTAMVASLGFMPMALSQSAGAEVQRPLATVVIGGLFTATMLTLLVLPVVFPWFAPPRPADATVAAMAPVEIS